MKVIPGPSRAWHCVGPLLLLLATHVTHAQDRGADAGPAAAAPAAQQIAAAVEQQRRRRDRSIAALVFGALAVTAGIAVAAADDVGGYYDEYGTYHDGEANTGAALVGLAIGLPCLIGGGIGLRDANRELSDLGAEPPAEPLADESPRATPGF